MVRIFNKHNLATLVVITPVVLSSNANAAELLRTFQSGDGSPETTEMSRMCSESPGNSLDEVVLNFYDQNVIFGVCQRGVGGIFSVTTEEESQSIETLQRVLLQKLQINADQFILPPTYDPNTPIENRSLVKQVSYPDKDGNCDSDEDRDVVDGVRICVPKNSDQQAAPAQPVQNTSESAAPAQPVQNTSGQSIPELPTSPNGGF